ncbi:DUF3221 domain-containing protein [Ureibacillus manganicus]|uniref:Uncharacterized protein n=1 Tax=Ureibacillus manganicus DSM 26584 TaxID=1384049 RepID=A0A0A3I2M5_9BACL|nr:DUF3221 domain-containing protein [Ureibacillus manganicus]KGR77745.1 hypothetical protein CD29_13935 [Ureibacillus manganicus DSM 26584]
MNEIKKSLIELTVDMNESKQLVRKRIMAQSIKKKDFKKNLIAGLSAIVMISMIFLTSTFLMEQQTGTSEISQPTTNIFDDGIFETTANLQKWWRDFADGEAYLKELAYEKYETRLALYTYAKSLGYDIKDEEVQESFQQTMNLMTRSDEAKQSYEELLTKADLTWEEYEKFIMDTAPYDVALKKLEQHYMAIYPKISYSIAGSLAEKHAIPYFREQYVNDIIAFKKKHTLPLHDGNPFAFTGSKQLGRVVAIEDNMFLVAPGATIEDIENYTKEELLENYKDAMWFPMDDTPELSIGDLVETYHKYQTTSEDNVTISDLWDIRLVNEYEPNPISKATHHLTIDIEMNPKVKVFVGTLNWIDTNVEFSDKADYQFVVDGITYQLWSYPDGFVLYSSRGKYRTLNAELTSELAGYLGIDHGLN